MENDRKKIIFSPEKIEKYKEENKNFNSGMLVLYALIENLSVEEIYELMFHITEVLLPRKINK
jgi:hypothetical protein